MSLEKSRGVEEVSWDKSTIETQIDLIKLSIHDFERKLQDRSYFKAESIPARINELKAIKAMIDAIIQILQSHRR